jgi:sterol desaturase/sphingolipid hydroxylase (fatty acid hydroxylase superfamily)
VPSAPDAAPRFALRTVEPTGFGTGWLSGVVSAALGMLGLGAVLCFHFPSLLTVPEARALYPLPYVRALLHVVLVAAFTLGALSLSLRRNKALGTVGVTATLVAALLGGSRVPIEGELQSGPFLGLDWFLLNLVLYSVVFIPLERLFARLPEQGVFRRGWRTDLTYFFVSTFLVQLTTILTLKPAMIFFDWAVVPAAQEWIGSLPGVIQFAALLVVADFTQYWVHRSFHGIPALWRFHAVHHSATEMDWLAGSRLHLVDIAVTRGLTYVPIYLLGFAEGPLLAYLVVVSAQATFIHANVRFEFGWLRWLVATPQFHHWHHAAEPQAIDKNFAVHVPALDVIFRTAYMPEHWPSAYGLTYGEAPPPGYRRQFVWPFRRQKREGLMAVQRILISVLATTLAVHASAQGNHGGRPGCRAAP